MFTRLCFLLICYYFVCAYFAYSLLHFFARGNKQQLATNTNTLAAHTNKHAHSTLCSNNWLTQTHTQKKYNKNKTNTKAWWQMQFSCWFTLIFDNWTIHKFPMHTHTYVWMYCPLFTLNFAFFALAARFTCLPDCSLNTEKKICDWGPQSTLRRRQRRFCLCFCCSLRAYLSLLLCFLLLLSIALTPPSRLCVALDANILSHASVRECSLPSHGCSQWGPQSSGLQWSFKIKEYPQRIHPCVWHDSHLIHRFPPLPSDPHYAWVCCSCCCCCYFSLLIESAFGPQSSLLPLSLSFFRHLCTCLTFSRLWG